MALLPKITRAVLLGGAVLGLLLIAFAARSLDIAPSWARSIMMIGGGVTVVFGGAAFLGAENRLLAVICAMTAGIAIFAVNGYLMHAKSVTSPLDLKIEAARVADPSWDERQLLEVVRDFRKERVKAVPYLIGRFSIDEDLDPALLPLGGVSTATTVICNEVGPWSIYTSDEHGFNNPPGWPEKVDVVVIGDSYAHGACVGPKENVSARLRERGHSVVNLGISGYGPMLELATLVEFGLALEPNAVVWIWSDNDYGDLVYELTSPLLNRYIDEPGFSQGLAGRQAEVDAHWHEYLERHHLLAPKNIQKLEGHPTSEWFGVFDNAIKLRALRAGLGLRRNDDSAAVIEQFGRVMRAAASRTVAGGGKLYFVDLPQWHDATVSPSDREPDLITLVGEVEGMERVDFAKVLYETGDPHAYYPYRLPAHYNAKGYALLADTIHAALRAR